MYVYTHVKISQVVTGLSPEQYLNNIVVMREQQYFVVMREQQYIVGPTISFILVSTILLSNDEATMFFMVVGNRGN